MHDRLGHLLDEAIKLLAAGENPVLGPKIEDGFGRVGDRHGDRVAVGKNEPLTYGKLVCCKLNGLAFGDEALLLGVLVHGVAEARTLGFGEGAHG